MAQSVGGILREDIHAERDQPPFDRVSMDGVALDSTAAHQGHRSFTIEGVQAAGGAPLRLKDGTGCIEVMTGAVLPEDCDAVVPYEQLALEGSSVTLNEGGGIEAWQNIHRRASDARQGSLLLKSGTRLNAPDVAIAAGAGFARVQVSVQPRVLVISTGDELVDPGTPILPHQVRRSNAYGVTAALRRRGLLHVTDDHVRDDAGQMLARLQQHLATHDVLILSGGVSMGKFDLVPQTLTRLGVREVFHKVEQRPGKPLWFGVTADGRLVFGLPGNPVSTLVCLARYVAPALNAAMGESALESRRIALKVPHTVANRLTHFIPVRVEADAEGRDWAVPRPTNGSGDFISLAGTDGFVELSPGPATWPAGFVAPFYRW